MYTFTYTYTKQVFAEHFSVPGPVCVSMPGERQADLGLQPPPAKLEDKDHSE